MSVDGGDGRYLRAMHASDCSGNIPAVFAGHPVPDGFITTAA